MRSDGEPTGADEALLAKELTTDAARSAVGDCLKIVVPGVNNEVETGEAPTRPRAKCSRARLSI